MRNTGSQLLKLSLCLLMWFASQGVVASQYSDAVMADHPVAYWKLDQIDGDIAVDEIGGNSATFVGEIQNSFRLMAKDDGQSIILDGSGAQYIALPDTGLLDQQTFSIELWTQAWPCSPLFANLPTGAYVGYRGIVIREPNQEGSTACTKPTIEWGDGSELQSINVDYTASPYGSRHLVVTFSYNSAAAASENVVRYYLDGVMISETTGIPSGISYENASGGLPEETIRIGGIGGNLYGTEPDSQFRGMLDEVAFYDYALTPEQVERHHVAARYSLEAPRVVSIEPVFDDASHPPLAGIRVQFNHSDIDFDTFTLEDIRISGPDGELIPSFISMGNVAINRYVTPGIYQVRIGSDIVGLNGLAIDQDQDGISGEQEDDVFIGSFTVEPYPPTIISDIRHVVQDDPPADLVELYFDSAPIDMGTFTVDDIRLTGPGGELSPDTITENPNHSIVLAFEQRFEPGQYQLQVGPEIMTIAGSGMDQDRDGVQGETPDDVFTTTFEVNTPVSPPWGLNFPLTPEVNFTSVSSVMIEGSREYGVSIFANEAEVVPIGSTGEFSFSYDLEEGDNYLSLEARDFEGNRSISLDLRFFYDIIAPEIIRIFPEHNYINRAEWVAVSVRFTETGSGIDLDNSHLSIIGEGVPVAGHWLESGNNLSFVPEQPWQDGEYQITIQLQDRAGILSNPLSRSFTLDTQAPPSPVIDEVPVVVGSSPLEISGAKEAGSAIYLNGALLLSDGGTTQTQWSAHVGLQQGMNTLSFTARDKAMNFSDPVVIEVTYENGIPGPVTPTVTDLQDGQSLRLDWRDYDEAANGGDIASYNVYLETTTYTNVSALTPVATLSADNKQYVAQGLVANQTYYLSVVAVDSQGNVLDTVTPVTGMPTTGGIAEPLGEVRQLHAVSTDTSLRLVWSPPADSAAGLNGYRIYFDGAAAISIDASTTSYEFINLMPATGYPVRVTTVDAQSVESAGVSLTGVTLLPNPSGLNGETGESRITLSWNGATPAPLVKQLAVYVSNSDFTSVAGMTPVLRLGASATSATVTGLENGSAYYLAVTAINLSDGETQTVSTIQLTPQSDSEGPVIGAISYQGSPLSNGATLSESGSLRAELSDQTGVSRVEFQLDGSPLGVDTDGSNGFGIDLSLAGLADGNHSLTIIAHDVLENVSTRSITFSIALALPAAPVIASPISGYATNQVELTVSGSSTEQTEILLRLNDVQVAGPLALDANLQFQAQVTLSEGENNLTAVARNRSGESPASPPVTVTLDRQIPDAPLGLKALSQEAGQVLLTWRPASSGGVASYVIYRANQPFETTAQAQRINTNPVTTARYTDLPEAEGRFYYRVAAENEFGTSSLLSNAAHVEVDNLPPRALSIRYTPAGEYDPATGRMAAGRVEVEVEVSEPLLTTPFLSLTPDGGRPISVDLRAESDTLYRGSFDIEAHTPSGTAYAVFSARDNVGNRGSEIDEGASILIDTAGPAITELQLNPSAPIHIDPADPANIQVSFTLDQPPMSGTTPELAYQLSAAGRSATPIDNLTRIDELHWRGDFTLPADAGLTEVETLAFQLSARDDLNTLGSEIQTENSYQVYQGDLPPLEIPRHLSAIPQPGGGVLLQWEAVDNALAYQVFRQAPGETELTPLQRVTATELIETTLTDGEYRYTVASVRQANDQESISGQSEAVSVTADSQAPAAPEGLTLELVGAGIQALWQAPSGDVDELSYRIYRAGGTELTDITGLTPLQDEIVPNRQNILGYLDQTPDINASVYTVTAVDQAGNESPPSASAYLNVELLPIATLQLRQTEGGYPELSWSHSSDTISGYNLYLDDETSPVNNTLLSETSYQDQSYGNNRRQYTITALDTNGVESLGRSVTLAPLLTILPEESRLHRGVMNRLVYQVVNPTGSSLADLSLSVVLDGHEHPSAGFSLAAGERRDVEVILGGYETLPDLADLQTTLVMAPDTGERVEWLENDQIPVLDSSLSLRLETRAFTRGATGEVRFLLENTSEVEAEILTARNQGDSPEIRVLLQDADGNVVTTQPFQHLLGDGVITQGNGNTLARIPAGEHYTSPWFEIAVPEGTTDQAQVVVKIDQIHYHSGQPDQVDIPGMQSRQTVSLVEAPYQVSLTSVTPQSSSGDEPILFQGQALAREDGAPVPSVPVELVLAVNGFERKLRTATDASGAYEYSYRPAANDGGVFTVSAVYPGSLSRPGQGEFTLNRYTISPTHLSLRLAKNYRDTIDLIKVGLGEGMSATQLHLAYDAMDQPNGQLPQGITLVPADPVDLGSAQSATLAFEIEADNSADPLGSLVLRLVSDESGDQPLSMINVDYELSEATPALTFTPNYVETGVVQDDSVTESLTLENRGLAVLTNVRLTLLSANDTPAPSWVYLMSAADQGSLEIGEQRQIQLAANPSYQIPDGIYPFKLRVESGNHPATDINVFVAVTQSGIGQVLFKASDIYTATLDENGDPIPGLAAARIRLQHEEVLSIEQSGVTDENGELLLSDLPAGRYRFRASAPNHQDLSGRLTIKPGITTAQNLFLDFDLITVEWSVTEITIEDSYEITLHATFETDVPAAVVVLEPSSTQLPEMAVGDLFYGELRLTNHGLIRADGVQFVPPGEDGYFRYEFLDNLPESLAAKESLVIPYRVTALAPYDPDGSGSGGGCGGYAAGSRVIYWYKCANDVVTRGSSTHRWNGRASGDCAASGGGTVSGGSGIGSSSGGAIGSGGPTYSSMPGASCIPGTEPCEGACCGHNGPAGSGSGSK